MPIGAPVKATGPAELRRFDGASDAWDGLALRHGTIFHTLDWLEMLEATQGGALVKIGVYAAGELVGILPVFVKRFFPLRVGASPLVVEDTPYLGLACPEPHMAAALGALNRLARDEGIHFLRLMQPTLVTPSATNEATVYVEKHTHVLSLDDTRDDIWKGMEGRCRTAIRKAEKSGVSIVRETRRECLESYYRILSALYAAQGRPTPNSKQFYVALWDRFSHRGLTVLTARHESTVIAGAILLHDRDTVYYLNGCSLQSYNSMNPNSLLQWEAIQLAKAEGAHRYDFVGTDIERLAKFKKSFGGTELRYTLIEHSRSSWVRAVRRRFPEMKRLAGRLRSTLAYAAAKPATSDD